MATLARSEVLALDRAARARPRIPSGVGGVLPGTLLVVLALLGPLALMLRYSFNRFVPGELMVEGLTLANYAKFLHDSFYRDVLLTTLWWRPSQR